MAVTKPAQAPTVSTPRPIDESLSPRPDEVEPPNENGISLATPTVKQVVGSPIVVSGFAQDDWFLNDALLLTLTNWDGLIIAEGKAMAEGSAPAGSYLPFKGTLAYDLPDETPYKRGFLIIRSGNKAAGKNLEIEVELK